MQAAIFRGVGRPLSIETLPDPSPRKGELVLRIGRCGICGSDLRCTSGDGFLYPLGSVVGHEFSGEVVAVGKGVDHYRIGDRVASPAWTSCGACESCVSGNPLWCHVGVLAVGGGAQYAVVQASLSVKLPASVSFADGALIEPLACALHSVRASGVRAGARVLILGAGPIGLAVGFWARRMGAEHVVICARSGRNEHRARALAATDFLLAHEVAGQLKACLGGAPPNVVFDCVGAPDMIAEAIDLVGPRGTVIVVGACKGTDRFLPSALLTKEVLVRGSLGFDLSEFRIVADTLDKGAVEPHIMITHTVSLEALPDAFEALRSPTDQCKVVIDPWA